jgi:hypothetical protein
MPHRVGGGDVYEPYNGQLDRSRPRFIIADGVSSRTNTGTMPPAPCHRGAATLFTDDHRPMDPFEDPGQVRASEPLIEGTRYAAVNPK